MHPQELLALTRAFVHAKFFDAAFFDAVAAAVASTAHSFTTRELAEMSWALGRAFQTLSVRAANAATMVERLVVPRSHRDALGGHLRAKPVRQEVSSGVPRRAVCHAPIPVHTPATVGSWARAVALRQAFAAIARRSLMLAGEMTCMDVSNILYGCACAGMYDTELLSGLTARLRRIAARLSDNIQARDPSACIPMPPSAAVQTRWRAMLRILC